MAFLGSKHFRDLIILLIKNRRQFMLAAVFCWIHRHGLAEDQERPQDVTVDRIEDKLIQAILSQVTKGQQVRSRQRLRMKIPLQNSKVGITQGR
jgi:hypothetical protein